MENYDQIIGSKLIVVDKINSTNSELLLNSESYDHGAVMRAKQQTAGRGRYQRKWLSQKGGLYFSLLLKDQKDVVSSYPFILLTALAIVRSLVPYITSGLAIKWPNDIYVNNKKICGILAESSTQNNCSNIVIGVGINVNNKVSHHKQFNNPAISVKENCGDNIDIDVLQGNILKEMDLLYKDFLMGNFQSYLPELNRLLYSKGQEIELRSGNQTHTVLPIAFTKAAELLCVENGVKKIFFFGEMQ